MRGVGGGRDGRTHALGTRRSCGGASPRRGAARMPGWGHLGMGWPLTRPDWPSGLLLCPSFSFCACLWCSVRPWVGGGTTGGCSFVDPPVSFTGDCLGRGVGCGAGGATVQFGDARFHQQTLDAIAEACAHLLDALLLVGL